MGTLHEQEPLLQTDQESTAGGDPAENGSSATGSARKPRTWIPSSPKAAKAAKYIIGILIIALVVVIVSLVPLHRSRPLCHGRPAHQRQGPINLDSPPPFDEMLAWTPPAYCEPPEKRLETNSFPIHFDPSLPLNVTQGFVGQHHHNSRGPSPNVWGDLIVRPIEGDAEPSIVVEIITNDDALRDQIDVSFATHDGQDLWIGVPTKIPWHGRHQPCVQMRVTVWIPSAAEHPELKSLDLHAIALHVSLLKGLGLKVHSATSIKTVVGDVQAAEDASLYSRDITVETVSNDVSGSWPLYDSLTLRSVSGDIDAVVNLKPMAKDKPLPARLTVSTVSGDIKITEPLVHAKSISKLFPRDHKVAIESRSGDIFASVAFSTEAHLSSWSGYVDATLFPLIGSGSKGPLDLKTTNKSGRVKLKLTEPLWADNTADDFESLRTEIRRSEDAAERDDDDNVDWIVQEIAAREAFRPLYSSHDSLSGDLDVRYPAMWRGAFEAKTMSGDISIKGDDVDYEAPDRMIGKIVKGGKGEDREHGSYASLETASGDISFVVG